MKVKNCVIIARSGGALLFLREPRLVPEHYYVQTMLTPFHLVV